MIKDSGARKEFSTGAVRDIKEGKGRCDLLPLAIVDALLGWETRSDNILVDIENVQRTTNTDFLFKVLSTFIDKHYSGDRIAALLILSVHYEEGALKYREWNWAKGIELWSFGDSAVRHYLKVLAGMTDESHDRAFMWNIICAIWTTWNRPNICKYLDYDKGYVELET